MQEFLLNPLPLWIFWLPCSRTDVESMSALIAVVEWLTDSPAETWWRVASPWNFLASCSWSIVWKFALGIVPQYNIEAIYVGSLKSPVTAVSPDLADTAFTKQIGVTQGQSGSSMWNTVDCIPSLGRLELPVHRDSVLLHTVNLAFALSFSWWIAPLLATLFVLYPHLSSLPSI